ncbi:MAG TPA: NAD(P)H-binding protein [Terriglobia bacterium]|nr:NAD(P)H-binding protein [Terriglobia bacterium]
MTTDLTLGATRLIILPDFRYYGPDMSRILLVGATGTVGRHLASHLAATSLKVRALVRNPDKARLPARVEVVQGDLRISESLDRPLEGVDTVFLVWTAPPEFAAPALERIASKARRIVFLSAPIKTAHPFFQQPNPMRGLAEKIERLIESSSLQWAFLRPGMFAANALRWWAPQIRAGNVVRWPYLAAPTAPIDERDVAAVALRALCEDGHAGAEYVLTGPQSLTQFEQLSTIGRVIGKPLHIEEMSAEDARREWLAIWPPSVINMLLDAWAAAIGQPAFLSPTFEQITGSPPRSFLAWATDHAAEFQA